MINVMTRPVIDMQNAVSENSRVLAKAAMMYIEKHPKATLESVIEQLIFAMFEVDEICDSLEAKIMTSLAQSVGCQIINTEEEDLIASTEEIDEVLDNSDLDDGHGDSIHTHDDLDDEDDNEDDD